MGMFVFRLWSINREKDIKEVVVVGADKEGKTAILQKMQSGFLTE